jgi:hypothetical protein
MATGSDVREAAVEIVRKVTGRPKKKTAAQKVKSAAGRTAKKVKKAAGKAKKAVKRSSKDAGKRVKAAKKAIRKATKRKR